MEMFNFLRETVSSLSGEKKGQLIYFKYTWSMVVFLHNIDNIYGFFFVATLSHIGQFFTFRFHIVIPLNDARDHEISH